MNAAEHATEHGESKRTPLYEAHVAAGGKPVDFHGWLLPIQYVSILQEHEAVRTKAGLFDVSHMGEIEISGPDSLEFLQRMLTNDISVNVGKAVYSPMCYPDGGTVDDLIVYKQSDESYLLVVNAANTAKDFEWLRENGSGRVNVVNRSAEYAQLAVQGPMSAAILKKLSSMDPDLLRFYRYADNVQVGGVGVLLSRTGYTGEDGFELYCSPNDARRLWDMLLDKGEKYGLIPAGLGARDTLRLEAALPLYGQELSGDISPVEAGLGRFVKNGKADFNGREPMLAQLQGKLQKKLAGFEMVDRAVPRGGYEVFSGDREIGTVTSGGFFPTLKKNMGLAMIDTEFANVGEQIGIKVRDGLYTAKIVQLPFYKRK